MVLSFSMPLTVLICAICDVICALSTGFIGSWFCNCVTSSVRKRSLASLAVVAASATPLLAPLLPRLSRKALLPVELTVLMQRS